LQKKNKNIEVWIRAEKSTDPDTVAKNVTDPAFKKILKILKRRTV
jgi:hypothetical protein